MADRVVSYDFRGNFRNLTAGLAVASKSVNDFGGKLTALDKNGAKMRAGLDTVGRAAGKVGLLAAAGLGAAVAAAANFDQAMSNVQAATHETTGNMGLLREAALRAGADTAFSASEAAGAIEALAKAGVSTKDILAGGLAGSLDLAAAGGMDVAAAAEQAATAMTQFKLGGSDVTHIADLLAAGAGKAQGEVTDLGAALNQSGLIANQVGLSIEETTGALSAFASAGLMGSDAGTSFKTMLGALTPNSAKAKALMDDLGISAFDAGGNFIGLSAFAGNLQSALSGMTDEQRQATLETIFGSDAVRAASVLYDQGSEGIDKWTNAVNDQGYAAETAATKLDNLKGDLEALRGSLETALIGTGDGAQGPLRSLVQNLTDVVNGFNKLSPAAKNAVGGLLGVTAVLGGGLWFTSKLIGGITSTTKALQDLGVQAPRTASAIKGIGSAAVGIGAIIAVANLAQAALEKLADTDLSDGNLGRDLEALADGRVTDNLSNLSRTFSDIHGIGTLGTRANPLSWISSWDPSGVEAAEKSIKSLDETLASMVEGGQADEAAAAFERLSEKAQETGLSAEEATDLFPEYGTAIGNAGDATRIFIPESIKAKAALKNLGQATDQASHAGARMAKMTAAQKKALEESRKSARESAEGFVNLGDKLDKAKVSLGDWLKQLEKQADALRDFRLNAEKAGKKGLDEGLIAALHRAGPAGALRMRQLANATDEEIARANRAWRRGQAEIDKYVDDVGGVAKGLRDINSIQLHDKSFTVHVNREGAGLEFLSGGVRKAGGGAVYGPGSATSDSIPARLSNGEYVIKASSVAKYGVAMFDALNSQRFANGGPVGFAAGGQARSSSPDIGTATEATAKAFDHLTDMSVRELRAREKNLESRQKELAKELDMAKRRRDAELEELRALKDARRELAQQVAGNFMPPDLFGEGATAISILAGSASASQQANAFEAILAQLSALGLDGSAFQQLSTSGNASAAQSILDAALNDQNFINTLEQSIGNQQIAAQSVGQYVGDQMLGRAIRDQSKEFRAGRRAVERLEVETRQLRREVRQVERAIHDEGAKATGRAVGDAVNGAATAGSKGRTP